MKNKRTLYIIATNFLVQVLVAMSGFLIPKLILTAYGSAVNGMVSSVSQFLSYAALVEMGIGNAAIVALYKPLAEKNIERIQNILSEAKRKYCVSGFFYSLIACIITVIYPLTVKGQIDTQLAGTVTLILALNGVIDYFIIGKYKVLLIADQKSYILNLLKCVATLATIIGSSWLLCNGFSLYYVKLWAVFTHLCEAALIKLYVSKVYSWIKFSKSGKATLEQQYSALLHQICCTVVYNTDLVLLTLLLPANSLKEISVYTVYAMAKGLVSNLVNVLTNGINASFGELFAKKEIYEIKKKFQRFEFFFFIFMFSLYSSFATLILSFVNCYTRNIVDVGYLRISLGVLFAVVGVTSQLKESSGIIANAAGHFQQTRKYALAEAAANLVFSILFIRIWGIAGALLGTIIAHLIMDIGIISYAARTLLPGTIQKTTARILRNLLCAGILCFGELQYVKLAENWMQWILQATIVAIINFSVFIALNFLFETKILSHENDEKEK